MAAFASQDRGTRSCQGGNKSTCWRRTLSVPKTLPDTRKNACSMAVLPSRGIVFPGRVTIDAVQVFGWYGYIEMTCPYSLYQC